MDEQRLWAPWRLAYVQGQGDVLTTEDDVERRWADGADHDCFICRVAAESRDRENLLVVRRPEAVCILNRFPYNNGHLLIAPLTHKGRIDELDDDEHLALMRLVTRATQILADTMHAEGFNVGLNLGRVAGAGLPGHLHWHVVPRWSGDVNFMPATAGIRVIPQALDELWQLLSTTLADDCADRQS
ncbi:MAG: HIT domain-containing protein [Planctomycetales bacterium]|nr:HIT domain-containing protein [Planctomycetales bacterium]